MAPGPHAPNRRRLHCCWIAAWTTLGLVLGSGLPAAPQDDPKPTEPEAVDEAPVALDEITVSASYSLNRETPVETVALTRQEILELPTFADDLFRAISLVPGMSGNDVSSAFSVRGAPYEEILVRLDGIELFEPFHLKDFSGVLSIVEPQTVEGVDIYTGSFPAAFGDRQAAVVDLTTRVPFQTETRAGASLSSVYLTRGNRLGDEERSQKCTWHPPRALAVWVPPSRLPPAGQKCACHPPRSEK